MCPSRLKSDAMDVGNIIVTQTAKSMRQKRIKLSVTAMLAGLIVIGIMFGFGTDDPVIRALLAVGFGAPCLLMAAYNFALSKASDERLLYRRREIILTDDDLRFRWYKGGKLMSEKICPVSELRGTKQNGPYLMFKVGLLSAVTVVDYEYPPDRLRLLKEKVDEVSGSARKRV